ncbi:MAG TPA: hypothetical protein VMM92_05480, partial [Thermoanaerobaculia bacterium]|nr:hypothetical protein [Thermoanaerobaculia bacterium]
KPANSVTTPTTPNCSFYLWSEQMFLWLTSPAPATYGGGGGRIFDSPAFYDVSPLDSMGQRTLIPHSPGRLRAFNLRAAQVGPHGLQIIFNKAGKMFEVAPAKLAPSGKPLINSLGKSVEVQSLKLVNGKPVFLDKAGKAIASPKPLLEAVPVPRLRALATTTRAKVPVATAAARAQVVPTAQRFVIGKLPIFLDGAGNVIDTEEGQADDGVLVAQNGSLVYYATIVNDVYAYFLTGAKDGAITPAPTQFPTTQAELNKVIAFASSHGKTFPDPNALAIEIKSSWVEAASLPNLSSYITMQATVPKYTKSATQWVPNGQQTIQLALVGMHVVGSTVNHPELIWATFEHFGNAPNAAYSYNSTTGVKNVPQTTAGTWLFSASGSAGPFNVMHAQFNSPNIDAISPHSINASDTLRMKSWGAASNQTPNPLDASAAASNTEIIAINNSVLGMLVGADIRKNYYMTGSTWTTGGAPTGSFPSGNEVGTSKLANTTMETYQQGSNTLFATGSNCFTCHVKITTMLDISHVYDAIKPLF